MSSGRIPLAKLGEIDLVTRLFCRVTAAKKVPAAAPAIKFTGAVTDPDPEHFRLDHTNTKCF